MCLLIYNEQKKLLLTHKISSGNPINNLIFIMFMKELCRKAPFLDVEVLYVGSFSQFIWTPMYVAAMNTI